MVNELTHLLAQARSAGLDVRADGERLIIRGPRSAEALALAVRDRKPEIMALLSREDAEVVWRVAAFRQQIPEHGPILLLYARESAKGPRAPGACGSCGDPLTPGRLYVCAPCQRALWIALGMPEPAREGGMLCGQSDSIPAA